MTSTPSDGSSSWSDWSSGVQEETSFAFNPLSNHLPLIQDIQILSSTSSDGSSDDDSGDWNVEEETYFAFNSLPNHLIREWYRDADLVWRSIEEKASRTECRWIHSEEARVHRQHAKDAENWALARRQDHESLRQMRGMELYAMREARSNDPDAKKWMLPLIRARIRKIHQEEAAHIRKMKDYYTWRAEMLADGWDMVFWIPRSKDPFAWETMPREEEEEA